MSEEAVHENDRDRNVFVVYGRDAAPRDAINGFLKDIHLNPLSWSEMVAATGKGSPYVGEVLEKGFSMARAVVVLMSPDDEAKLKLEFQVPQGENFEKELMGQPRPNVLIEAGMALASHPEQTLILQFGELRPISDIAGRHLIRVDGLAETRKEIVRRLKTAGCSVDMDEIDWDRVGQSLGTLFSDAVDDTKQVGTKMTLSSTAEATKSPLRKRPTLVECLKLGEHLWYLSNPPWTTPDKLEETMQSFRAMLEKGDLEQTRTAAVSLDRFHVTYDLNTGRLSQQSISEMEARMGPIRRVLEAEIASFDD